LAEPNIATAVVTIAFGALAGGITNAVAIWMLFHPYEPRGVGKVRLQGAIPKNKPRLAKTIGRTVGQRLLTSKDLARQLSNPGLREAFDRAVANFVEGMLSTERKSLREELPTGLVSEIESVFDRIAPALADRLSEFAQTDAFLNAVRGFQTRVTEEVGDRPISEILTDTRRESIRKRVEEWVADAVMSQDLADTIHQWLDRQVRRWESDNTPLLERMPAPFVAAVEKQIAGYIPIAIDRIASALGDPGARENIQRSLHRLFEGFVNKLLIHERIVAKLVVTERTISRLLDNVERDGVEQVARLFEEPDVRNQVARSVNDAVVKFLRKPLSEHLATLGSERIEGIKDTVTDTIVTALRDETTRGYVMERVDQAIRDGTEGRTIGEILRRIPADQAASWAASAIATPRVRGWIVEGSSMALNGLLDRPIGRPVDRLHPGSVTRISAALAPAIWSWIQDQVPTVVEQLDIQQMVEEKVLGFSLERIEQIVRNTTQRELDLIIKLGYLLGALVGGVAYLVSIVIP